MLDCQRSAPTLADARRVVAELTRISPQIEHRLFSFISMNWRGKPLTTYRTVVELIAATTTQTGLTVQADFDEGWYPTGVKVTDAELAAVPIKPHDFHPGEVGGWLDFG